MSSGNSEFTAEFFTESSNAWMKNKLRKGASMSYICTATKLDGNPCTRPTVQKDPMAPQRCSQHKRKD